MSGRRFTFGPFLLDGQRAVLLRDGQVVPVGHPLCCCTRRCAPVAR